MFICFVFLTGRFWNRKYKLVINYNTNIAAVFLRFFYPFGLDYAIFPAAWYDPCQKECPGYDIYQNSVQGMTFAKRSVQGMTFAKRRVQGMTFAKNVSRVWPLPKGMSRVWHLPKEVSRVWHLPRKCSGYDICRKSVQGMTSAKRSV